jgi:hypothetical protein
MKRTQLPRSSGLQVTWDRSESFRIGALDGSKLRSRAFDRAAEFVNVVQNLQSDLTNEVATVRHDAQEPLVLQADRRFSDRRSASLVPFSEFLLAERLAGLVDAMNDVPLEGAVNLLAQRRGRIRGGRPTGQRWRGGL